MVWHESPTEILLALTGVAALSVVYPASVQAVPTTYQYTGNPFTVVAGDSYTTSDFVTAMVTLAGPLGANMPLTEVTPTAFTLFDGVQTLTNTSPGPSGQVFSFATNARGEINLWFVEVFTDSSSILSQTADMRLDFARLGDGFGFNEDTPGVWTLVPVADTGSTLSLMTLTLMALGLVARRFKRAAA